MERGIINLSNLVKNEGYIYQDKFYIDLYPRYKRELFQTLIKESKTIRNLSKEINVSFTRVWDQLTRVSISIEVLNKLSNYLTDKGYNKFNINNIQRNILYIKSGGSKSQKLYNPKFPINLKTKEGIRFIAHLYHDGGIGEHNKQPLYINQSKEEILQFLKDSKKLFGDFRRKIKMGFGNGKEKRNYYAIHLPTVIGEIMIKIGYQAGDKTKQNTKIFKFIKSLEDEELICEFLSKAFNDDGFIGKRSIGLTQACLIDREKLSISNVLLLDKLLLEKLNICHPRLDLGSSLDSGSSPE